MRVCSVLYKSKDCKMANGRNALPENRFEPGTEGPLTFALPQKKKQKKAITIIINGLVSGQGRLALSLPFVRCHRCQLPGGSPCEKKKWVCNCEMPSKPGSKVAISSPFLLANKWLAMRTIAGNSSWPPYSNCSLNRRQKRSPECGGRWKAQARESHLSIGLHQPLKVPKHCEKTT